MLKQPSLLSLVIFAITLSPLGRADTIDVMVVFDATAFATASNRSDLANGIVANANDALVRSQLTHRYNLVYVHGASLSFATGPSTTTAQIQSAMIADPVIPQLRNQYKADLVVLVAEYMI